MFLPHAEAGGAVQVFSVALAVLAFVMLIHVQQYDLTVLAQVAATDIDRITGLGHHRDPM